MLDEPGRHQQGLDPKKTCAYKDAHAANRLLKTGKKTVPTISLGHSWLEQFYEVLRICSLIMVAVQLEKKGA